ncbi:MAG: bifunctional precorrin-2 dehydrogenase/sirohydrochlorin ferrochelatase [Acidobacteriaceae bacterium]|nr:bifunctional precorrin-2 dehydrogenase/sirohydrochlorin ferrochelatase [Acidobacteriaceae bacterium]
MDVASKKCLVTGDGYETFGKVKSLLDCGAQVVYVNPHAHIAIEALAEMGRIKWVKRDFEATDLNGCFLVITDREDNSEVFRLAEERNILCNSVDDPEHCRFSFGSVLRRGDLAIAISTNGRAPALAVRLKEQLACEIGLEYEELMSELSALRPEISQRIQNFSARRDLWYRIVDSDVLEHLRQGERQSAHQLLRQMLEDAISNISRSDTCGDSGDP